MKRSFHLIILDFFGSFPWILLLLSLSISSLYCNPSSVNFAVLLLISASTTSDFHKSGIWFIDASFLSTSVALWSPSWQSLIDIPWTNCTKLSSLVLLYVAVRWDSSSLVSTWLNTKRYLEARTNTSWRKGGQAKNIEKRQNITTAKKAQCTITKTKQKWL